MKNRYRVVTFLLLAFGNVASAFENPEPREAEKQREEVRRQPYMDELPDEVSAMAGLWRTPSLGQQTEAGNDLRHQLDPTAPNAQTLKRSSLFVSCRLRHEN